MEGLKFIDFSDPLNQWPIDKVAEIVLKTKEYAEKKGLKNVLLHSVEDWSKASKLYSDPNNRIDIEIRYTDEKGKLMQQKLLMLKGEILDATEFHERRKEFYPA